MNVITVSNQSRAVHWCEPQFPEALDGAMELLRRRWGETPIIGPDERSQIPGLIAHFEEGLRPAVPERIEAIVAYLSTGFPKQNLSDEEAQARLSLYVGGLDDLPEDALQAAARKAVRECKFFPTVKELREFAWAIVGPRKAEIMRLQRLADKHDAEWRDPATLTDPDKVRREMGKLVKRLGSGPTTAAA